MENQLFHDLTDSAAAIDKVIHDLVISLTGDNEKKIIKVKTNENEQLSLIPDFSIGESATGVNFTISDDYLGEWSGTGLDSAEIFNAYDGELKNIAIGYYSHAEGMDNIAFGNITHVEGSSNIADSANTHVEGSNNYGLGECSHTEGSSNYNLGWISHIEGTANKIGNFNEDGTPIDIDTVQCSHAEGTGNNLSANYAHAEGMGNTVTGMGSHAEGNNNKASGAYSHVGGEQSTASAYGAFAHGYQAVSSGLCAVSFGAGKSTADYSVSFAGGRASGVGSLAHGTNTATGKYAVALNGGATNTGATGDYALCTGFANISSGKYSSTFGWSNEASGIGAIAGGYMCMASGDDAVAFGLDTKAASRNQFVIGTNNIADTTNQYIFIAGNGPGNISSNALTLDWDGVLWVSGDMTVTGSDNKTVSLMQTNQEIDDAHTGSIVKNTFSSLVARLNADFNACITQSELEKAIGNAIITAVKNATDSGVGRFYLDDDGNICGETFNNYSTNEASGNYSHAEGSGTAASGNRSHAEGCGTTASHMDTHAEGSGTTASAPMAHAEGGNTTASGECSHAEGGATEASGQFSHSEGAGTTASGKASHGEGNGTEARGMYSHAEGDHTIAASAKQHAGGRYNIADATGTYAVIIGNGTSDDTRSNALTLDWRGSLWLAGDLTTTDAGGNSVSLIATNAAVVAADKEAKNNSALMRSTLGMAKKNLLKNTAGTMTQNGITFTRSEDGSVTCSGTATADTNYRYILSDLLPDTDYILSGCPSGGSTTTYNLFVMDSASGSKIYRDTGSSVTFNTGDNNGWHAIIRIAAGQTVDGLTFSPMLRYADVTDGTYEAYTPSLQEQIDELKAQIAAMTAITTDEIEE